MNYLHNMTYFDIYEKNANFKGSSIAIHFETEDITYSDLFLQTAKLASGLKSLNLPESSRIAVLCKNHPVFFHL
ncbi:MAG: long-chain fatty acid--CoA ligase, partial [Deltaproteobacteria bacterium]|nr:long-chain fatty acid--CoA ligase [Deltaproteobacteria bacterium]